MTNMTCEPTLSDSQLTENRICSHSVALWKKKKKKGTAAHPRIWALNTQTFDGVSGIVQPTTLNAHAQRLKSCPLIDLCVWYQKGLRYQFWIVKVDVLISRSGGFLKQAVTQ